MIKINNTSKKFKTKILFLLIFCFIFLTSINICLGATATPAAAESNSAQKLKFRIEVAIPGFPKDTEMTADGALLGKVINGFYNYMVWLAGILAVIVIMVAGFQWVTAAGNQSKIGEAKERITSAVIGLVLALGSYLLLYTINPKLIEIQDLSELKPITPMDEFCDADQYVLYGSQTITGNLLVCGEEAIVLDSEKEKTSYTCYGSACIKKKACYEKECLYPSEICRRAGREEFNQRGLSIWNGKVNGGWTGEITSVSFDNYAEISGYCYKYTLYTAGIDLLSLEVGDFNWNPEEVYEWGFVDNKAVSAYLLQIKADHSKCNKLDLKDASKFMACKKSSHCKFTKADLISPNRCVEK